MITYVVGAWWFVQIVFRYWTGRAIIAVGFSLRGFFPPEAAHNAYLAVLRWQNWLPGDE